MPCTSIEKSAVKGAGNAGFQSFVPTRHFSFSKRSVVESLKCSPARVCGSSPVAYSYAMSRSENTCATGVMPVFRRISGYADEMVPRMLWVF